MKVGIREEGPAVVVRVDGSILQENVPLLRERLSQLIEDGQISIVIDMSDANYLSSLGVAVIVDARNRAMKQQGDVKLACVNRLVKNLLDITNLSRQIKAYDTVEEAVSSFAGNGQ
jgi:anti-sigma B factor antagonist